MLIENMKCDCHVTETLFRSPNIHIARGFPILAFVFVDIKLERFALLQNFCSKCIFADTFPVWLHRFHQLSKTWLFDKADWLIILNNEFYNSLRNLGLVILQ
jgi:hypothetical protein